MRVFNGPGILTQLLVCRSNQTDTQNKFVHFKQYMGTIIYVRYQWKCSNILQMKHDKVLPAIDKFKNYSTWFSQHRHKRFLFHQTRKNMINKFQTKISSFLNITIDSITVSSLYTPNCFFGGLTIFDKDYTGIISQCDNFTQLSNRPALPLVSNSETVYIVLFSFKHYSSVNASVLVSTTECKGVLLNPCHLKENINISETGYIYIFRDQTSAHDPF